MNTWVLMDSSLVWRTARPGHGESCEEAYRPRLVATRLVATFFADGALCFAFCACPDLVFKRDSSYISIHCSLEIAAISVPIPASGKSSGDSKCTQHFPMSSFFPAALNVAFSCS